MIDPDVLGYPDGAFKTPGYGGMLMAQNGIEIARVTPERLLLLGGTTPESAGTVIDLKTGKVVKSDPANALQFWLAVSALGVKLCGMTNETVGGKP